MTNGTTMTQAEKKLTEWMERQDDRSMRAEAAIAAGDDRYPELPGLLVASLDRDTIDTLLEYLWGLRRCDGVDQSRCRNLTIFMTSLCVDIANMRAAIASEQEVVS
jgi:hypothetical protein